MIFVPSKVRLLISDTGHVTRHPNMYMYYFICIEDFVKQFGPWHAPRYTFFFGIFLYYDDILIYPMQTNTVIKICSGNT